MLWQLGITTGIVTSNSMAPSFVRGDIIVIKTNIEVEKIKPGDIIAFKPGAEATVVVHRVIRINTDKTFETKGDASPTSERVSPNEVKGKVAEFKEKPIVISKLGLVRYPGELKAEIRKQIYQLGELKYDLKVWFENKREQWRNYFKIIWRIKWL